ncbi:MAG: hypothetical protein JWM88_503 [Verrucomicrobia bacterium]|nr:hypothetical protein [Verrucomicrobiota bacterium]
MISHPHRCLYVHIPKTAGNSVNRAFGIGWENHKDLQRYAGELPPQTYAGYYKFAIVRNPWDRLFSDYNYQCKKSRDSKLFLYDDAGARRTFPQWVRAALSNPHRYRPDAWGGDVSPRLHRWSPQVDWITVNGRIEVDGVLRLENLRTGFRQLCRTLKIPALRLPRRNRRLHCHYSWYYDDVTRDLVAAYYARDIAAFGYKFELSPLCRAWRAGQAAASALINVLRTPLLARSLLTSAATRMPASKVKRVFNALDAPSAP